MSAKPGGSAVKKIDGSALSLDESTMFAGVIPSMRRVAEAEAAAACVYVNMMCGTLACFVLSSPCGFAGD